MKISMYEVSVPRILKTLRNLDAILSRTQDHVTAKKIDPSALITDRLFPDMLPFSKQIQIASDNAKGAVARLAGVDIPKYEDNEQTFDDLHARLSKTIKFIESVDAKLFDGSEDRKIELKIGGHELNFTGMAYLLDFALPNVYFHVATAYNILRHNGVEIGKADYLGNL